MLRGHLSIIHEVFQLFLCDTDLDTSVYIEYGLNTRASFLPKLKICTPDCVEVSGVSSLLSIIYSPHTDVVL